MKSIDTASALALHHGASGAPSDPLDRAGFDIGWDHARHGLVPPPGLLLDGTPLGQGWRAGRAVFGGRTLGASRSTRQWLALRTRAWKAGVSFEEQQVTPNFLAQIAVERCPVLRVPLGGAPGEPDAAVIARLNPHAAYAAGNLVMLSQRAADALESTHVLEACRRAYQIGPGAAPTDRLDSAAWHRLACLRSFATPLRFFDAARLPLAVLPPNRVRVLNAAQGLQALVSRLFTAPGWAARTRQVAEWLPEHSLRHDYNLFIGSLTARVIEAGALRVELRLALEDAWLQERVQRRWQHFVFSLGEDAAGALLERVATLNLAGQRLLRHDEAQATEGWALEAGGRAAQPALPLRTPPLRTELPSAWPQRARAPQPARAGA